jgi:hypothetical protein
MNQGLYGAQYSRFRISPGNLVNFYSNGAANNYFYIFRGVSFTKYMSLYSDDTDATILDVYVKLYQDAFTQDIEGVFN